MKPNTKSHLSAFISENFKDLKNEDGLINKLEVSLKKAVDGYRLSVLRIRKTNIVTN